MDLVFFAHFAGSPHYGMVFGHYYLAKEWVEKGHNVTIVAASHAHTRIRQPQCRKGYCEEWIDGIRYLWIKTKAYTPDSHVGRVLNILGFTWRLMYRSLPLDKADVIICSSHHPFPIIPAYQYSRRFGARLVFEVRDLWPLTLMELGGVSKRNPFIAAMQWAENFAYRRSDMVVSVLSDSLPYMQSRGLSAERFLYIPNGVVDDRGTNLELPDSYYSRLQALKNDEYFLVGYAGRIGLANALHTLIESLADLKDLPIKIVLLGDGSHKSQLVDLVRSMGLQDDVLFFDSLPKNQVGTFLNYMDAVYLGLQNRPLFQYGVSPTKLNDYMMAGKPVIYAVDAPPDIVTESQAGMKCRAEDSLALANCIRKLFSLAPEDRATMGENGRKWLCQNRNYGLLADRFLRGVLR